MFLMTAILESMYEFYVPGTVTGESALMAIRESGQVSFVYFEK